MAMCRCVEVLIGRKEKNQGTERSTKGEVKTLCKSTAPKDIIRESEDEHEDSPSIKRELSDFDLQAHEAVASEGGYDPADKEIKHPSLYENQANIQLEDRYNKYSKKSVDIIQSGHVSDPGIGKADFWASPKLERSCSNLERRDVLRKTPHHFPSSKSQSFEDFQELSANQMVNLASPRSVMTQCSADRVMLRRHSSSQVLPSGSKGKAMRLVESPSPMSSSGEYFDKSCNDKNTDNQRWSRFHKESFGFWTQNQWVAFSTESSSFNRVDEWVKDLEVQQPPPEDGFGDDNIGSIVFPPSPDAGRSMARSTAQLLISGIGVKAIPALSHFSSLRSVNLSNNFIVHITPGFLPKGIHTLNLSRNKISTIEGLRELTRLRVLDLSYNRISRIGQGLSNCTLVKELYLAGNKISDVEGLHRLLKLTVLDLSFNKITTAKALGQLVANYNSLQALNLLGNPIQSNISDDQLRKAVCGLLPKLVYLNKQSIKPQRAREILTDSVAKAALGNSSRSSYRRALKKGGQGGSSSSSVHRSSASVAQKSKNRSRSRTKHH
ncbi:Leucine-rich repeat [Sesbania bispinosa]|nr:Leucine-rich repeat [Sesbania bispinosa]